ncbi:MAG: hypothetical protein IJZ16_02980 [Clostridia bacterium]|nr:hypothetical protein [Clostridia bacterium]
METGNKSFKDYYVIDLAHIVKSLFQKMWAIILAGVIVAGICFSAAAFVIEPLYSSSVRLYVNNSSLSLSNASLSISSSEISAAQSLVRTYIVILKDQTTLEQVIKKAELPYNHEELYDMIDAYSVDDTEVMKVEVTSTDPHEAAKIANCIADVLQIRIAEIIKGTSMEVVGYATPNLHKISPSITKYTALGFVLGVLLSGIIVVILALKDNTIHDEDYLIKAGDYPLLAKVPDLFDDGAGKYGSKKYGYGYGYKKRVGKEKR